MKIFVWIKSLKAKLAKKKTEALFKREGPLAQDHMEALLSRFEEVNGLPFNSLNSDHVIAMQRGIIALKVDYLRVMTDVMRSLN